MKDSKDVFLTRFLAEFEEDDLSEVSLSTDFRSIDGWDSMTAMSIIAMIDEKYDKVINPDQMAKANKILDVYLLVFD